VRNTSRPGQLSSCLCCAMRAPFPGRSADRADQQRAPEDMTSVTIELDCRVGADHLDENGCFRTPSDKIRRWCAPSEPSSSSLLGRLRRYRRCCCPVRYAVANRLRLSPDPRPSRAVASRFNALVLTRWTKPSGSEEEAPVLCVTQEYSGEQGAAGRAGAARWHKRQKGNGRKSSYPC
jgi:hypothetical protein